MTEYEFSPALQKLKFDAVLARIRRYAQSPLGIERIDRLHPLTNPDEIQKSHALLNEMKRVIESDEPLPIDGIHDIRTDIHRAAIEGNILSGKQLLHIYSTLGASRRLREYFRRRADTYPQIATLAGHLISDNLLEHHIEEMITDEGVIRDSASRELQDIRRAIRSTSETLRRRLERILKTLSSEGMTQEELITTREGRMVLPVKVEFKHRVPGFIHSSSASGATVFIEPAETLDINNELREHQIREQREIERLLRVITEKVSEKKNDLLLMVETLAEVDFIYAKAQYSIEIIGVTPIPSPGVLRIVDARHPILLHHHKRDEVVPLTLSLGEKYRTMIITGPNAGGKSVAMQTVGLMSLMYQSGLHLPVSELSEMPVFGKIFVAMGDEQSIEQDLSTFTSHLLHLRTIVSSADDRSLVLIDEIGAGTDPVEGSAIAASILKWLTRIGALTVATTHHGDLKAFAFQEPGIENGAMEFDQEKLTPTYRFTPGVPGSSYALEIAYRLRLPSDLLEQARVYLGSEKSNIEGLLIELEQQSQSYKQRLADVTNEKRRLETLMREYEEKLNILRREMKTLKRNAAEDAKKIVDRANALIEGAVKEIKESAGSAAVAKRWRTEVKEFKKEIERHTEEEKHESGPGDSSPIGTGDIVALGNSSREGEVLESFDEDGYTHVLFGSVKMKVHRDQLRKAGVPKDRRELDTGARTMVLPEERYPRSVDVRGLNGDEAVGAVELFLDRALLAGYKEVEIIHGKGTGVLRKRITEYLKGHTAVGLTRLGNWNEGGAGVTIVELATK
jgi:DNA mismatch repair protein MutS2